MTKRGVVLGALAAIFAGGAAFAQIQEPNDRQDPRLFNAKKYDELVRDYAPRILNPGHQIICAQQPVYPREALLAHQEGFVFVEVGLNDKGDAFDVSSAKVIESQSAMFNANALAEARRCRIGNARLDTGVDYVIPFTFRMDF